MYSGTSLIRAEESVIVSGVLISEVEMHARVVLGVGKGVLSSGASSEREVPLYTYTSAMHNIIASEQSSVTTQRERGSPRGECGYQGDLTWRRSVLRAGRV